MYKLELTLWDIELLLMCIGLTWDEMLDAEKDNRPMRFNKEHLEDMYELLLNWRARMYNEMENAYLEKKEREKNNEKKNVLNS